MPNRYPQPPPWEWIRDVFKGDFEVFKVLGRLMRSPLSGRSHQFHIIESPDWVNIIPVTAADEVILVRQFRFGRKESSLETPGGLIDPGESPFDAAQRELHEETGYHASTWTPLGSVDPNPALFTNRCHFFLAAPAFEAGPGDPEETEELSLEQCPLAAIPDRIREGAIRHALVIAGFYLLDAHRRRTHSGAGPRR